MPRPPAVSPLPWRRSRLANGAGLVVLRQPWAERAGICLRVAAGSHDEPPQYPGLAHFLEHLLFLGGREQAVEQGLMAYARGHGGQVNASTRARHTDFVCELPAEHLQPALRRLLDMLCRPALAIDAQLREREVLQAEYLARSRDADSRIDHALGQALAAGHRCADFLAGERASLPVERAAFQQALLEHHRRHYRASRMSLALVGPQPLERLQAIAEALLKALPDDGRPAAAQPPAPMLPLRAPRLALRQAGEGVHLGHAVQLDEPGLDQALELLFDALHDPAPGGLLAGLRDAGLCRQVQGRVPYRHAGQRLLRFDFAGAGPGQAAALRAGLQGWLRQVQGDGNWPLRLAEWRRGRALRDVGLAPLALARQLQERDEESDETRVLRTLGMLLAQMASGAGLIELCCAAEARPPWPATGLTLPLAALPARELPAATAGWRLPRGESLLTLPVARQAVMPLARLRWHPAAAGGGPAALHWRGTFSGQRPLSEVEAILGERLVDPCRRYQSLGVCVHLVVQPGGWTLALQGASRLLPACSARLLPLLLAPLSGKAAPRREGLLLRRLLQRLPELAEPAEADGLQGLGVGLEAGDQARVESLFAAVEPLSAKPPLVPAGAGLDWRQVGQPGDEAALLLFCPLPGSEARDEAAWRLLGHCLEGAFYQRLRGELQLGYALFSGFRQVQGRRGLLFALQSPVCDAAGIFAHIRAFLAEQRQRIAGLDDAAFAGYCAELGPALDPPGANGPRAERLWQTHLAGLPEAHPQRVRQALAGLTPADLLGACERLLQAGDWRVLASGPRPAF